MGKPRYKLQINLYKPQIPTRFYINYIKETELNPYYDEIILYNFISTKLQTHRSQLHNTKFRPYVH